MIKTLLKLLKKLDENNLDAQKVKDLSRMERWNIFFKTKGIKLKKMIKDRVVTIR